jgi:hypothetical protein
VEETYGGEGDDDAGWTGHAARGASGRRELRGALSVAQPGYAGLADVTTPISMPTSSHAPSLAPAGTSPSAERRLVSPAAAWGLATLALLPFAAVYAAHALGNPAATGFLQVDSPYYAANGREVFERGNGFAHPNPYEHGAAPPAIYFHWFTWLLGFGIVKLGLDPGVAFVALGALGALLFSRLTLSIVLAVLDDARLAGRLYLGVMWGGGLLCLGRVAQNLAAGREPLHTLLLHDPFAGQWFLSWGRNAVLPTEAVYHALSALVFLSLLRARWRPALLATAALAATHPWSGAQVLAIVGAWAALGLLRHPGRAARSHCLGWLAIVVPFGAYYFAYLPTFPEHRVVSGMWEHAWGLPAASALLAYGPVGLLATWRLWRLWRDQRALDARTGFLLVAFGVSFALVQHDLLLDPVQPLHFTRGYVWLPLCLLALPLVQRALLAARARWRPALFAAGCSAALLVASADNLGALGTAVSLRPHLGLELRPDERDVFRWMDTHVLDGILLCSDVRLGYLSATYTRARPYCGHVANTPDIVPRLKQLVRWKDGADPGPWDPPPDLVLVPRDGSVAPPSEADWHVLYENESLVLHGRDG